MERFLGRIVSILGTTSKNVLHALVRAFRTVILTFVIVALIVALATFIIAAFVTGHILPTSGLTYLAAAALGIAFGWAAGMTVLVEEIFRALIKIIELAVEETEKLAKEAAQEAAILAKKAEEEAVRFGRTAVLDAEKFGVGAFHGAEALGQGVAGLTGGAVRGVEHGLISAEHTVTDHLPGHHTN